LGAAYRVVLRVMHHASDVPEHGSFDWSTKKQEKSDRDPTNNK
jgi:hypothetical protein